VGGPFDVATDTEPVTIVLADDHAMVRAGLRGLLESEIGFSVVGEAGDVEAALRCATAEQPAVVLLDLNMPGGPTVDAIPRFLQAAPKSAVVMLTMQDDIGYAREALGSGASGYVLKSAAETELVEAVRAAARGGTYLTPALGARLARAPAQQTPVASSAVTEVTAGSTFAGHRIDGVAGAGGMGIVYRATDLTLDRPVALKLIAPALAADPVFRARFERECRLAAALDHPHIVEIFHAGEESGRLYVTMRYVDGTDLKTLLARERWLDPARAVAIVDQVAGALDEAHGHGLVHRDVKPANVLIAGRAGRDWAYLTDFGVTKDRATSDTALTGTGIAIGSVDYMAPEQAQVTDVDARADVYALGCILFHAVTGSVPFIRGNDLQRMWAHVHEPPPAPSSVDSRLAPALDEVVLRALAKDPAERYQSAGELGRAAVAALA
jgi:DNA-binding NarL/FixJ family response regulator